MATTPKRKRSKRYTTDRQYRAMLGRMMRAYERRVGTATMEELTDLVELRTELDAITKRAIGELRRSGSYTWEEIGTALGVSRQAAQQRYGLTAQAVEAFNASHPVLR